MTTAAFERAHQRLHDAQRAGNLAGVSERALRAVATFWPRRLTGVGLAAIELEQSEFLLCGAAVMAEPNTDDDHLINWAYQAVRSLRDAADPEWAK